MFSISVFNFSDQTYTKLQTYAVREKGKLKKCGQERRRGSAGEETPRGRVRATSVSSRMVRYFIVREPYIDALGAVLEDLVPSCV